MPSLRQLPFGAFVVEAVFLGDTAAFALGDGTVRLIGDDEEKSVAAHLGAVLCAAPTRDRRALVTGGDDGRVARIDARGEINSLAEHGRKWVDHIATGPNGTFARSVGRQVFVTLADGRERVFDLPRAAGGLAFAPKGQRLAVARYDGVTLLWVGTEVEPVMLPWKGAHLSVSFSPDARHLVTTMQENALHGWRLDDGKDMRMSGYPAKTRSLAWTHKGRFLATSGANAAILWPFHFKDGPMGKEPVQLGPREVLVTRVAAHPRREAVAIGYQDGMVLLADIAEAKETLLNKSGDGPISALAFDHTGRRLALGSEQGKAGIVTL